MWPEIRIYGGNSHPLIESMPGYRAIPDGLTGDIAHLTRESALCEDSADHAGALLFLEQALQLVVRQGGPIPGYLCGRLALLYRQQGRHADEVTLLERHMASQASDHERTHFSARLSKARVLLEKSLRRNDCGALASIRNISASQSTRKRRSRARQDPPA